MELKTVIVSKWVLLIVFTFLITLLIFAKSWGHNKIFFPILSITVFLVKTYLGTYTESYETGYSLPDHNIFIDYGCAGINYFIICILTFSHSLYKYRYKEELPNILVLTKHLGFILIYSSSITIFANAVRIICSIQYKALKTIIPSLDFGWMHLAIGSFIYLLFLLIFFYIFLHFIFKRHEPI